MSTGGPKPLWSNRPPAQPPASEGNGSSAEPDGMPKPLWSNRAPAKSSDSGRTSAGSAGLGRVAALSVSRDTSEDGRVSVVPPLDPTVYRSLAPMSGKSAASSSDLSAPPSFGTSQPSMGGVSTVSLDEISTLRHETSSPAGFSPANEAPKKYIRQYELGPTLGKGSYAKVKMCKDLTDGKTYAIKIFNKSLLKRRRKWDSEASRFQTAFDDVLREIAIMRKLDHENVMTLRDVIDDSTINKLFMVIAYCKHGAVMDSHELPTDPLPVAKSQRYFADAVAGLDYLHFQDIVHFDLKPDNILIADDGRAVIADFGVSRMELGGKTKGSPGTPTYTAPEVWGQGKYDPKAADVWALGVTLHAMVFGTLPFFYTDQQELVDAVTAPEEWRCTLPHEEPLMVELLHGIIKKNPEERMALQQVRQHEWVLRAPEVGGAMRRQSSTESYKPIEVDQADLQQAIITGHIENFRRSGGSIFKTTSRTEAAMFQRFSKSAIGPFMPKLKDVTDSLGKRMIIEMEDLTHEVAGGACLMDIKMGTRTFTEEDANSVEIRDDFLAKMDKVKPDEATPAERAAGGITKMRYLQFREASTTTSTLGFRIDAVRLPDNNTNPIPDNDALRKVATPQQVREAMVQYVQRRPEVVEAFLQELKSLRTTLESCPDFMSHSFIRSSLLFVYSDESDAAVVRIIDLPKVSSADRELTHRSPWSVGNHEDGYLAGLDNMVTLFEELRGAMGSGG